MRLLHPGVRNQQEGVSATDIERTVQDSLGAIACNGHSHLFSYPPVATIERGRLGQDRLIQHQDDRALAVCQAPLEPPFA